jgi:hypothetical protein
MIVIKIFARSREPTYRATSAPMPIGIDIRHVPLLALLPAKPRLSQTGHRAGTFLLVLPLFIPGAQRALNYPSNAIPLGQLSPSAPSKVPPARMTPAASCAVAAPLPRDFVPWRFSDASRRRAWTGHHAGVREPAHNWKHLRRQVTL